MTDKINIPEEFKTLQAQDGVTSLTGKFTQICDFGDGAPSTAFFTASDNPNWYAWLEITPVMHPTILTAINNPTLGAWIMVNEKENIKLLRVILHTSQ